MSEQRSTVPSAFKSALLGKCPKCRRGDLFATPALRLFGQKMNERCPHCRFHFEIEPGYFYVAMFISYAINVAIMVSFAVGTYVLSHSQNPWVYLAVTLVPALLFAPLTFRYSRIILLYCLTPGVHFEPERAGDDYPDKYRSS